MSRPRCAHQDDAERLRRALGRERSPRGRDVARVVSDVPTRSLRAGNERRCERILARSRPLEVDDLPWDRHDADVVDDAVIDALTADADECWEQLSALVPEDENSSVVLVEFSLRELRAAQDVITSLMPVPGVSSWGSSERLNRMTVVVNPGHPSTVARLREVLGTKARVIVRREDWYLATGTA